MSVTFSSDGNRQRIGDDYALDHIGLAGTAGFSLGVASVLPSGMSEMEGTRNRFHDNYGNYQFADGSIMCYVPAFYYKYGTGANGLPVNVVDIRPLQQFSSESTANSAGYALHRAFKNGGLIKKGVFVDKYLCSKNALGSGFVASSIALGNPISTNASHNPIAGLTAVSTNAYFECITAAKARDGVDGAANASSIFFCNTRFIRSALAILSMAHGQAAQSAAYCAWYDGAGTTNFPKGCNNNALGDVNDGTVSYTSDGYPNAAKTGSGSPFARTTHNGQSCGIADLNGNMWEIELGLTRPGSSPADTTNQNDTTAFYMLKESVDVRTLTAGWSGATDAWGDAAHLVTLYDAIDIPYVTNTGAVYRYGNGANQVLSEAISGDGYRLAGLGLPMDANARSSSGTNLFGTDFTDEYHRANLVTMSGGSWSNGSNAGVWMTGWGNSRQNSSIVVGFRCACYPD